MYGILFERHIEYKAYVTNRKTAFQLKDTTRYPNNG